MPSDPQILTLGISGMSCGHCVAAVTSALEAVPEVRVRNVSIGSATIELDTNASPEQAIGAVRDAGYEATLATSAESGTGNSRGLPRGRDA